MMPPDSVEPDVRGALDRGMGKSSIPHDVLDAVDRALTSAVTTAITLGPSLSEPFADDPRWTPDTRFLAPMGKRAMQARTMLRKARAEPDEIASQATEEAFSAVYNAILDPGHYTEQLTSFPKPMRQMEPVARWQTRAVLAALGRLRQR